jgi:hypothetical protein
VEQSKSGNLWSEDKGTVNARSRGTHHESRGLDRRNSKRQRDVALVVVSRRLAAISDNGVSATLAQTDLACHPRRCDISSIDVEKVTPPLIGCTCFSQCPGQQRGARGSVIGSLLEYRQLEEPKPLNEHEENQRSKVHLPCSNIISRAGYCLSLVSSVQTKAHLWAFYPTRKHPGDGDSVAVSVLRTDIETGTSSGRKRC